MRTFGKTPDHEMLRIIVQEGRMEPAIVYMDLEVDNGKEEASSTKVTFDSDGGSVIADMYFTEDTPGEGWQLFPVPTNSVYVSTEGMTEFDEPDSLYYAFLGWYDKASGERYFGVYSERDKILSKTTLELTARWSGEATAETPAGSADREALVALTGEAGALDAQGYTAASWDALQTVLAAAAAVAANVNADQSAIGTAYAALRAEMGALESSAPQQEARAALKAAINEADALNGQDYTAISWDALQTALTAAKAAADNADAGKDAIDAARNNLQKAINALERATPQQTSKTALNTAITQANALTASNYTAASWASLQTALASAKAVSANAAATQAQADAANAALRDAISALVRPNTDSANETGQNTNTGGTEAPSGNDTTTTTVVVEISAGDDSFNAATGVATVTVTQGELAAAVSQAVTAATAAGSEPVIVVKAEAAATAAASGTAVKKAEVKIPVAGLKEAAESAATEAMNVKIESAAGEITLNKAAVKDLVAEAGNAETVEAVITHKDKDAPGSQDTQEEPLTPAQQAAVNDEKVREVYDISLYADGTKLDNFRASTEESKLTVGLPYRLKEGEAGAGVLVKYIGEDGYTEPMDDGREYDGINGLAKFRTSHLSVYAVTYEPVYGGNANEADDNEETGTGPIYDAGSSGGGGCGASGFGMALLWALAIGAALRRKTAKEDNR
jgi:hypothetical protein